MAVLRPLRLLLNGQDAAVALWLSSGLQGLRSRGLLTGWNWLHARHGAQDLLWLMGRLFCYTENLAIMAPWGVYMIPWHFENHGPSRSPKHSFVKASGSGLTQLMAWLHGSYTLRACNGVPQRNINSEQDFHWALAWVCVCLVIHSLVAQVEDVGDEEFWDWVHVGLEDEDDADPTNEVEGFLWHGQALAMGETLGQQKQWLVQEALFQELYSDV
ncbi:hypothetical protein BS47DRAFT_1358110 [Hydnum rufescens UP504]|uniref:Uncharacterized protein n=1 Tax=Hydnum rufescens UP504 TaxID=1448309 RepID=A0A9P6E1H3_9AGAM|nr:hypothetical protein BS47DRAFT_1358110 [Hydnum rufescens UP504]